MTSEVPDIDSDTSPIVLRTWAPDGTLEVPNRPVDVRAPGAGDEGATAPGASRSRAPQLGTADETVEKYMRRWEDSVAISSPEQVHVEALDGKRSTGSHPRTVQHDEPSLLLIAFGSFAGTLAAGGTALGVFLMVT